MKVTYSKIDDAAYIYLVDIKAGVAARTEPCEIDGLKGEINLDFDKDGRLVGIEVLGASKVLPKSVLDGAKKI